MALYRVSWLGYPEDLDYGDTPVSDWVSELVYETDSLDEALRTAELNTIEPGSSRHPPVMVAPHVHDWHFVDGDAAGREGPVNFYTCGICAAHLTEVWGGQECEDFPEAVEWVEWGSLWLPEEQESGEWD